VFTAEDVWLSRFPGETGSVHLQDIPETPGAWADEALAAKWSGIRRARRVVTGALEVERREKRIGASLEAVPVVHVEDDDLRAALASVDFADLCITSGIVLSADPAPADAFRLEDVAGIAVVPTPAAGEKCQRCWKVLPDVGQHSHPGVCARCDAALG
jgi:isoleucyl-tRNA synthetase